MLLEVAQTKISELKIAVINSSPPTLHKNVEGIYVLVPTENISLGPVMIWVSHTQVGFEIYQGRLRLRHGSWPSRSAQPRSYPRMSLSLVEWTEVDLSPCSRQDFQDLRIPKLCCTSLDRQSRNRSQ